MGNADTGMVFGMSSSAGSNMLAPPGSGWAPPPPARLLAPEAPLSLPYRCLSTPTPHTHQVVVEVVQVGAMNTVGDDVNSSSSRLAIATRGCAAGSLL